MPFYVIFGRIKVHETRR